MAAAPAVCWKGHSCGQVNDTLQRDWRPVSQAGCLLPASGALQVVRRVLHFNQQAICQLMVQESPVYC